jgi:hypothetical protein
MDKGGEGKKKRKGKRKRKKGGKYDKWVPQWIGDDIEYG